MLYLGEGMGYLFCQVVPVLELIFLAKWEHKTILSVKWTLYYAHGLGLRRSMDAYLMS